MYNEEIKAQYIEQKNDMVTFCMGELKRDFEKMAPFEEKLEKDLCNFTYIEISDIYKTLNFSNKDSLANFNSNLSLYSKWANERNMIDDGLNHYEEFEFRQFKDLINPTILQSRIVSKEKVYEWINKLVNPRDAFCILAFFEGLNGFQYDDLSKLTVEQLDQKNNIIHLPKRDIVVSTKLIELALESNQEPVYTGANGKSSMPKHLVDSNLIVKEDKRSAGNNDEKTEEERTFAASRRIYNGMARVFKFLDGDNTYMTINSLIDSGKIYWLNEKAKELNVSVIEAFYSPHNKELKEAYEHQFDCVAKPTWYQKYKEYFE